MNLESTLIKYIFPQEDNDTERAKRLVTVVGFFEKKQNLAFAALIRKQKSFHENLNTYIKMCEDAVSIYQIGYRLLSLKRIYR
jgi:sister-chromatid-cohesion protein PDS5